MMQVELSPPASNPAGITDEKFRSRNAFNRTEIVAPKDSSPLAVGLGPHINRSPDQISAVSERE
jgi:hypothetical protein